MPELPEVEVTRLSFAEPITGAKILSFTLGKPLRWPLGMDPAQLHGRTILGVRRRGKYLLMDLNEGLLLWHLGMSGHLRFWAGCPSDEAPGQRPPGPHDHATLITNQGMLRLNDPRRFGAVVYAESMFSGVAKKLLGQLGPEPFSADFTDDGFHAFLKQRQAAIKQVLLAGQAVVGVGNIYASEALFLAGIRPTTRACRLTRIQAIRLRHSIIQVLHAAVAMGGSTLRDFSNAQGKNGYFQLQAQVYDRTGLPCNRCESPIKAIRQGQRSTFYCPKCQS